MGVKTVLVASTDRKTRQTAGEYLLRNGFLVMCAETSDAGIESALQINPDIMVIDNAPPMMDAFSLVRILRESPHTASTPFIILISSRDESKVVSQIDLTADDYITKPLEEKAFTTKVGSMIHRSAEIESMVALAPMEIHNLKIHPGRHEVLIDGKPVNLTSTEFRLLNFLARQPGWVFSRDEILEGVHGVNHTIIGRAVDVQIVALRKKLKHAGKHIETVRGKGYRLSQK